MSPCWPQCVVAERPFELERIVQSPVDGEKTDRSVRASPSKSEILLRSGAWSLVASRITRPPVRSPASTLSCPKKGQIAQSPLYSDGNELRTTVLPQIMSQGSEFNRPSFGAVS